MSLSYTRVCCWASRACGSLGQSFAFSRARECGFVAGARLQGGLSHLQISSLASSRGRGSLETSSAKIGGVLRFSKPGELDLGFLLCALSMEALEVRRL